MEKDLFEDTCPVTDDELGAKLNETQNIAAALRALSEETVSLTWRSDLNERIAALQPLRRSWSWIWKPASGMLVAGALAFALMVPRPEMPTEKPRIEAELVSAHKAMVQSRNVTESGLTTYEIQRVTGADSNSVTWSEADLGTL